MAELCPVCGQPDNCGDCDHTSNSLHVLANTILSDHPAPDELYEAVQPFLTADQFRELGLMLELCPVHCCDFQICLDDQVHGDEVYLP